MAAEREHIPEPSGPSNRNDPRSAADTAWRRAGPAPLSAALEGILRATGAERAFLVADEEQGVETWRVVAAASRRPDGEDAPSRSIVCRALRTSRPVLTLDAGRDRRLSGAGSVRALGIRGVVSFPVALPAGPGALVLDSRVGSLPLTDSGARLLAIVAALLPLVPEAGRPADGEVEPDSLPLPGLVGRSPAFLAMAARVRRAAACDLPVLVTGESGTGKEGIAMALHALSPRARAPFLAVNCAAVPESLLESELYGVVRGAYTGADADRPGLFRLANRGTLLLDEVGDMPLAMQAKLLRVLQDGRVRPVGGAPEVPVDVRVVASTHRELAALTEEGCFRADLYYRLAVIEIRVPPLRERRGDVEPLARHLLARLPSRANLPRGSIDAAALDALAAHDWPGNVRELETVLARALLSAPDGRVTAQHLDLSLGPRRGIGSRPRASAMADHLERSMIAAALESSRGSPTAAAALIGWSRQKLYRRAKALGLPRREDRKPGAP